MFGSIDVYADTRAMTESGFHPATISEKDWESGSWLAQAPTSSGEHVTTSVALTFTAVHAAIRVLSETIGSLPWSVFRKTGKAREELTDHPVYPLIHDSPNTDMSSVSFRESQQAWKSTHGNCFALIRRTRSGSIFAFEPMASDLTRPYRDGAGYLRYEYPAGTANPQHYSADQVLHVPNLGGDGIVGWSPIRLHRETIGMALAAQRYGAELFANDGRPIGTLKTPDLLDDLAYQRLKSSWRQQNTGHGARHGVQILEQGTEFVPYSIPPEDAQFLQTREFQVVEIARIYRISPHLLQDLTHGTFSNIEELGREFVYFTMLPHISRWEAEYRRKLFPNERDIYVKFNLSGLLRGDIEKRYKSYAVARQWGWMSANDIRELEDMDPVEGGNEYLVPLNMSPAGKDDNATNGGDQ